MSADSGFTSWFLTGGDKAKSKTNSKGLKGTVAVQVPPTKATGRSEPVDRISAE
jgi:hypothetical protein